MKLSEVFEVDGFRDLITVTCDAMGDVYEVEGLCYQTA